MSNMDEFIKILEIRLKYFEEDLDTLQSTKEFYKEQIVDLSEALNIKIDSVFKNNNLKGW